jgi:hypothetical protein
MSDTNYMKRVHTLFGLCAGLAFWGNIFLAEPALAAGHVLGWGLNASNQASPVLTNVMTDATSISAGYYHSLALKSGRAWAWGNNGSGQTNVPVAAQSGVSQIAGGGTFSLALKTNGEVVAWGSAFIATNVPPAALSGVTQIAAGESHALALKNNGVIAWGDNTFGQTNVPVSLTSGVSAISGGGYFSMALKSGGVQVFGIPATNSYAYGIRTIPAAATSGVSAISAGRWHALALKNGGVIAWGASFFDATNVPVEAQSGVASIAAGDQFSIALKTDGTLVLWGAVDVTNGFGLVPVPNFANNGITQIAAGAGHGLVVSPVMPPRFLGASLLDAYSNTVYSGSVSATGDPQVVYYKSGSWPDWMTLDPNTGAIGGTPFVLGNDIPFSVLASNSIGQVINSYTVDVLEKPPELPVFVTTNPLPDGVMGTPYSKLIVASNAPVFSLDESGGNPLPLGLTLATNGLLSGIPEETYSNKFIIVVASNLAGAVSNVYNITIKSPSEPPVFYTTSPLTNGVVGQPYSVQIVASNAPVFSLFSGSLPTGLGLTVSGLVTGTPTQIQSANFIVQATNVVGSSNRAYQIEILGAPTITTTSPLPQGVKDSPYSVQIVATGNPLFSVVDGSLPGGLNLSTNGLLSGTPTVPGDFTFMVRATNVYGWNDRLFDLSVAQGVPVFVTTSPLTTGVVGTAYSKQIVATGNPIFSLFAGSLPGGLNLSTNGLVSGTPTAKGAFNFTVRATNAFGWSNAVFALQIEQAPVFVTASPLPSGALGNPYSVQIVASNSPLFSLFSGSLPGGLNLNTSGLLSGTPTNSGAFNFTVRATNSFGWSNRVYDLTVANFLPPSFTFIRYTNSAIRLAWTNPNATGSVQVWRATNITAPTVLWSNLGVQTTPWTNDTPLMPSYYQLRVVP